MQPVASFVRRSVATGRVARVLIGLVFAAGATVAHADVPGRVGRIAFMQGDVQAYSESDPEWKAAYLNQPLTSRNSVFVGDTGRVEISVGSTTLAMDGGSQVDIQQLDDNTFDANVVRGHVSMQVRRIEAGDVYNVASPDASFALLQPGRYRIDALDDASGITVFSGQASAQGERSATLVAAGSALRVVGDPSNRNAPLAFQLSSPSPIALDQWMSGRESRFRASQSERYVSPNMTGYEDLEANGRWSSEPDVGPVWYPANVQQDWAPYRYGRWAYVAPWGYTWIDDAPWGFAPFHYGRWVEVGGRWGWVPGAYVARPVYAPALVTFYGGPDLSASFEFGVGPAVGWYPLAPWERYSPHYTRNAGYLSRVNNIGIVDAPPRFADGDGGRDWRRRGATLAPQGAFASQRSISGVVIAAPRGSFDRAPFSAADLPRPASVPGALRRGPERNAAGRPDFRPSRDFASRGGPDRAAFPTPADARGAERNQPSNDLRHRVESRPGSVGTVQQPNAGFPDARGANRPGFDRDTRAEQPAGRPNGDGQGAQRYDTRGQTPMRQPTNQPTSNPAVPLRSDGDRSSPQTPLPGRFDRGDRQIRDNRNMQPLPQGTEREQVFERPQRPVQAPVTPAAPMAPTAPVREQRAPTVAPPPQPQIQPQPQQVQPQQQRPQPSPQPSAPRGGPGGGQTNDNPFAQPRG